MATAVASMAGEDLSSTEVKRAGLVDAHAYSLIAAQTITTDNGSKVNLVQIRNPWGQKEWDGDWSDKSDLWTEKTKAQVNYEDKNDGTFWISFVDYISFFYITTICFYREDFEDNCVTDQHEFKEFGMTRFSNPNDHDQPLSFTVDQINSRFVDETMNGDYNYPAIKLILTKIDGEGDDKRQVFIDGQRESDTHVCFFLKSLPAGEYILMYQSEF